MSVSFRDTLSSKWNRDMCMDPKIKQRVRNLTGEEMSLLQGFPRGYILGNSKTRSCIMTANAVSTDCMQNHARHRGSA